MSDIPMCASIDLNSIDGCLVADINDTNLEEIQQVTFSNSPIWRSASVVAPAPAPDSFDCTFTKPMLTRNLGFCAGSSGNEFLSISSLPPSTGSSPPLRVSNNVPEIPLLLMTTHFHVSFEIEELTSQVTDYLKSITGLSFEYVPDSYHWLAIYIIEFNRLNGDSSLYRNLFVQFKSDLVNSTGDESCYDPFTVFTPLPNYPTTIASSADLQGLGPILRMAQAPFAESQLEAARTLCDLSADEEFRGCMVEVGCVDVLVELYLQSPSYWTQQHALVALANLCDNASCLPVMLTQAVPVILRTPTTGGLEVSEIKVLSAYILSKVCAACTKEIVAVVGIETLLHWIAETTINGNERARLHAERARDALTVEL